MKPVETLEQIKNVNHWIKSGQTGTPAEFAATIGIRQSHLIRCLHQLEHYGMDLHYSRLLKTYYDGNDDELIICCSVRPMASIKMKEIIGGERFLKRYHRNLQRMRQGKQLENPDWQKMETIRPK